MSECGSLESFALFGAGVASFLAPCIVPLVPAYLGIIVGEVGDAHDPARAVPATLIFIAGFTTVFAFLGAVAGLLGSSLSTFQDIVLAHVSARQVVNYGLDKVRFISPVRAGRRVRNHIRIVDLQEKGESSNSCSQFCVSQHDIEKARGQTSKARDAKVADKSLVILARL